MALNRITVLGLKLGLAAISTAGIGTAVHATASPADALTAPARPALSAGLMPACGSGAMVNIAQAALGDPRPTGPATPGAAVTEFAAVVGIALPVGALEQARQLSDHEALVQGPASVGHVVRHGDHWQADYLAVCVPAVVVPGPPLPDVVSGLPLPAVPAVPGSQIPDLPVVGIPPAPRSGPDAPVLASAGLDAQTATTPSMPVMTGLGQR